MSHKLMSQFVLAISLFFALIVSSFGDGLDCFNAAYRDSEVAPSKDDFWRRPEIVTLCEGASGIEPLKCYKSAFRDQELFSTQTPWERSVQAIRLCTGATSDWPIRCLKSTKSDESFQAEYKKDSLLTSQIFTGLCAKASDSSRFSCFKKAIKIGGFMLPSRPQSPKNTYTNYIESARLCGSLPDLEMPPDSFQESRRRLDESQKKFEDELDYHGFWKTLKRDGWREAFGFQ